MNAAELLNKMYEQGIHLMVENGSIRCRSSEPLSDELIVSLKVHKAEVINLLQYRKQRHGKPYLKNGELRVRGLLPPGTMLDTLIELNASDDVIGCYIGPKLLSPKTWERWETIKAS